jgi:hypothetical protein
MGDSSRIKQKLPISIWELLKYSWEQLRGGGYPNFQRAFLSSTLPLFSNLLL